ncbi:hypothetical protein V8G54_001778 [Vigna mungo]|uniref:Uncharacterized protein n=1 Tax=Vigna mungo TaxID=3915 RepID=A0AAQ3P8F7_VIGMU
MSLSSSWEVVKEPESVKSTLLSPFLNLPTLPLPASCSPEDQGEEPITETCTETTSSWRVVAEVAVTERGWISVEEWISALGVGVGPGALEEATRALRASQSAVGMAKSSGPDRPKVWKMRSNSPSTPKRRKLVWRSKWEEEEVEEGDGGDGGGW